MLSDSSMKDSEVAIAGIYLFHNECAGPAPSRFEIEDWQGGRLSAERAAEVLSHVANDAEFFQQLLDFQEASEWLEADAGANAVPADDSTLSAPTGLVDKLKNLLWPQAGHRLPVLAGAMAVLVAVLLAVPLLQQSASLSLSQKIALNQQRVLAAAAQPLQAPAARATKDLASVLGDAVVQDRERHAVRRGMSMAIEEFLAAPDFIAQGPQSADTWRDWQQTLPAEELECATTPDPEACKLHSETRESLGNWALTTRLACQQGGLAESTEFAAAQTEIYGQFAQHAAIVGSDSLKQYFAATDPAADGICTSTSALVDAMR